MNPCVGSSGAIDDARMMYDLLDCIGEDLLDRQSVGLDLPTGVEGAVVSNCQGESSLSANL